MDQQKDSAAEFGFSRRSLLQATTLGAAGAALAPALSAGRVFASPLPIPSSVKPFAFAEATISDLQARMKSGAISSHSLTEAYLARIQEIDKSGPAVNSVIEINPDALSIAEALDKERKQKAARGPMHGIPVLIKDNIETADRMQTTAGSLALVGPAPAQDSTVARRLREAGAVILGKTNLSEWANIRSSHSISGWSGRGGLTRNPYALDRNACGSSSGSGAATSASLC
ncbi:MAG TPA: amidase family protein, partial [Terriglobales bacterium]